jgi:glycosyltransferase involved in cell wall biosynthesis
MKIAVIIPCFDVVSFCEKVIEETICFANQIVLVDDGSTDGTGEVLNRLQLKYPNHIHVIRFPWNQGKGFALLEGFRYMIKNYDFDVLITLDADGQHLPSAILTMAELIRKGADFVIGQRAFSQMPPYSRIANIIISIFLKLRYFKSPKDNQSGLRAFNKEFAKEILDCIPGGRYEMEFRCILLALKKKKKITLFPIPTIYFNKNIHSHFRKIVDSLRILKVIFIHFVTLGKI